MKIELIRIGNSRGVRIPKPVIEQCGFGDTVDLSVEGGRIIIAPVKRPREGWAAAFEAARNQEDELLLDGLPPSEFDRKEWDW